MERSRDSSRAAQERGFASLFHLSTPGSPSVRDATVQRLCCSVYRRKWNWDTRRMLDFSRVKSIDSSPKLFIITLSMWILFLICLAPVPDSSAWAQTYGYD